MMKCRTYGCGFVCYSESPALVELEEGSDKKERSTNYAVKVLYVLGFISCGDGCTEASRMLGLLGLPNDTTMESRSFGIIEDRISPRIQEVSQQILKENLIEEV